MQRYVRTCLWACCVVLCINVTAFAAPPAGTGVIKGVVSSTGGNPLAAAIVIIHGTKYTAATDDKGQFTINNITAREYQLEAYLTGYETAYKKITVTGGETIHTDLQLKPQNNQLDDVVVTGQYAPQSLRNAVYKVRVINSETIKLRNATNVLEVLNNEIGVRFSTDLTLGETDVQLMGMSGQYVKVLLDGVPIIDRNATKQSLSQIDISTIDRIEIVEGPMSVVYGTDALAGVINIITKKGAVKGRQLGVSARIQEETAGKEYNGFDGKGIHNENITINWQNKGWYADAALTRNNFGGWQGNNTGRAKEWFPKEQWLAAGTVGYRNKSINAWYRLNYLNETIFADGNVNPNTLQATDAHYITNRYTHQAALDWFIKQGFTLNTVASYQDYTRATQTTILDTKTGDVRLSPDAAAQDVSSFKTVFFRTTAQYVVSPKLSLQPGIEYERDNAGGQRIEGSPVISNYAFFASAEIKPTPAINIRPGIRVSKNSTYAAPPVIPSLNTKFTLSKTLDMRLAYARGFRAPALRELYFWFFDANHSIKGNPDLKAENSNSVNGSFTWHPTVGKDWQYSSTLTGFYNHVNNRIDLALGQDASNPNVYTYINVSKYKTAGAMLENTIAWKQLKATIGISYIGRYNQYADDTAYNKTNATPQFVWSPEVNTNVSYNFKKAGLQVAVFYKYTGKLPLYQLSTINNQTVVHLAETAAFSMADVNLIKSLGKYISVSGGVKNIFNVTRLNNTSTDVGSAHSTGGPVPMSYGRSYFIGLNIHSFHF